MGIRNELHLQEQRRPEEQQAERNKLHLGRGIVSYGKPIAGAVARISLGSQRDQEIAPAILDDAEDETAASAAGIIGSAGPLQRLTIPPFPRQEVSDHQGLPSSQPGGPGPPHLHQKLRPSPTHPQI